MHLRRADVVAAISPVLRWLLEPQQPPVRYFALRDLMGRSESNPEVRKARAGIPRVGWAADILAKRRSDGSWEDGTRLYRPKYLSTHWMLLVLSDLGLTRKHPAIRESCELWIERFAKPDGGFGLDGGSRSHLCLVGNTARALIRFGYSEHPAVIRAMEWLVKNADPKGGWSCFGAGRNLDSWEGLSAFAVYPRRRWTPKMEECVSKGAEFFLSRELQHQGARYAPWYRTHYPVHYYYDLLVGLDVLTSLGYSRDPRVSPALAWMRGKRRADGRWDLDAAHPDLLGGAADWYRTHPTQRPVPFQLEAPGRASKWITLKALVVEERVKSSSRGAPLPP
ncbi:MAG: terpene cyclase/mutase family protein [Thermoplasmata archaeon]|nr:terpene cyclase/mutase family protein [Thermoplasmata archaeon]